MASQRTPQLGLVIFPDITGVYQQELRESYLLNFQIIDEKLGGTPKDVYTKEQVDAMLLRMSELLTSQADFNEVALLVNTLMAEETEFTGFGASVVVIDDQATELIK